LPTAGKLAALDKFASQFFSAAESNRSTILKLAQEYVSSITGGVVGGKVVNEVAKRTVGEDKTTAEYYIKAMQRIAEKGEGWVAKETTRIGKLLESPSLAPEKLDELQRKNNILSAFVHRKYDEAADYLSDASLEDVEDAVRHATASVKVAAGQATDRIKEEL
jgi:protein disulfide-isomerase A6